MNEKELEVAAREATNENVDMEQLLIVLCSIVDALNDIRDVIVQK